MEGGACRMAAQRFMQQKGVPVWAQKCIRVIDVINSVYLFSV
jgi:hypothetical protein